MRETLGDCVIGTLPSWDQDNARSHVASEIYIAYVTAMTWLLCNRYREAVRKA